jgi:hypothetical protein
MGNSLLPNTTKVNKKLSGLDKLCPAWVSWFEPLCVPSTWGFNCCGPSWTCSAPPPGFDPLCARLSPPRCLTCSWACRMSSGPWGIVVVRVSWPGHPTWIKKKKEFWRQAPWTYRANEELYVSDHTWYGICLVPLIVLVYFHLFMVYIVLQ